MSKTVITEGDEGVKLIVKRRKKDTPNVRLATRMPVHVVYGGADRFSASIASKLGSIALKTLETYASNFVEFANAFCLPGTESLPNFPEAVVRLDLQIAKDPSTARSSDHASWFAWTVYQKTVEKLKTEPVEDFRIDFEDGYGFRADDEEDADAFRTAKELAQTYIKGTNTYFSGLRVKSFAPETYSRSVRTLNIFLSTLLESTAGLIPPNFVVTLPKVSSHKDVRELHSHLTKVEKKANLPHGSIKLELMIETPAAIIGPKGNFALRDLVNAGKGRVIAAHFGAYDYTSSLGIAADFQGLRHEACVLARQLMLLTLSPMGIRLADSVTTQIPTTVHNGGRLSKSQTADNRRRIFEGWRTHFENVTYSMSNGFYQSWDLHPNQLPARYAAVYSFFLRTFDSQTARLRDFIDGASRAMLSGNTFDDAASAQGVLNFLRRGSDCGAFNDSDVASATGLTEGEFRGQTFQQIIEGRRQAI
ncbi:MAG TPA: aldolase/citrate lyase family protein [Pyrinomonadaceae bacterium]|nr:phosphoenolpyruvate kinase [Chloracidobacterium sp.]HRJ88155.1 aldolase/citrate lyase family protein [Pyrinomonadaceae bacterium]HRK49221.1 aldolase/citrate lyase family protein [Pyrinomonadaceae bacterium]